ncbi:MAG: hypothetical protein KJO35_10920 [Gammaproteobacteria bacterium]|nr:hypothetical protein [Gammaproteobacteria bacterium]
MKGFAHFLIIFSMAAVLSACEPKKVEKNVWDDQTKALEKAKEVEDVLMKRADDMARELEDKIEDEPPNK